MLMVNETLITGSFDAFFFKQFTTNPFWNHDNSSGSSLIFVFILFLKYT